MEITQQPEILVNVFSVWFNVPDEPSSVAKVWRKKWTM